MADYLNQKKTVEDKVLDTFDKVTSAAPRETVLGTEKYSPGQAAKFLQKNLDLGVLRYLKSKDMSRDDDLIAQWDRTPEEILTQIKVIKKIRR